MLMPKEIRAVFKKILFLIVSTSFLRALNFQTKRQMVEFEGFCLTCLIIFTNSKQTETQVPKRLLFF